MEEEKGPILPEKPSKSFSVEELLKENKELKEFSIRYQNAICGLQEELNSPAFTLEKMVNLVLNYARELTDSSAAWVGVMDPIKKEIINQSSANVEPNAEQSKMMTSDDWRAHFFDRSEGASVPAQRGDKEIVGGILVKNKITEKKEYTKADISILSQIAQFLALAADKVQSENEFFQAQKMEPLGQLIAEITHEYNNLIMAISGNADLLKVTLREKTKTIDIETCISHLNQIQKTANRFSDLTKQILSFSHKLPEKFEVIDLKEEIASTLDLLERVKSKNIKLDVSVDSAIIRADKNKINQVVMNLVINALHAMAEGGELIINTKTLELKAKDCDGVPGARVGKYVRLLVKDNGSGIDDTTREFIFDPFFTTKAPDKGTGLGLSSVKAIVEKHKGFIKVVTEKKEGTEFNVYFPAVDASEMPKKAQKLDSSVNLVPSRTKRVLVVEDEESVRRVIVLTLENKGYAVEAVKKTEEAEKLLNLSEESKEPIDLILSDVGLPGEKGDVFAARMKKRRPKLAILLMSGAGVQGGGKYHLYRNQLLGKSCLRRLRIYWSQRRGLPMSLKNK